MMIAASFCRQRRLARSVSEPSELLNQAVLKTLECEDGKQWNKKISMVRHLDRAMENISGHLVRERMKIVAFPDGLKPQEDDSRSYQFTDSAAESAKVSALLKSVFGDDDQAKEISCCAMKVFALLKCKRVFGLALGITSLPTGAYFVKFHNFH